MDSVNPLSLRGDILRLLNEQALESLRALLSRTESFDLAAAFHEIPVSEQLNLLPLMSTEKAAALLPELEMSGLLALLHAVDSGTLLAMIPHLEPDDAADVLGVLDEPRADDLLASLPREIREPIESLLTYPEDSAGGIMDPDVVTVNDSQTVDQALEAIRSYVHRVDMDEFFSVFVLDDSNKLVGVVPNWKMLLAQPGQRIRDIMTPDVVSVHPDVDQEEIAHLVRDHDLVTVPVVDESNLLLGRVTIDDVVDVIQEEFEEDIGRIAGTGSEEVREHSIAHTLRLRTPWLLIALAGQFGSAMIMESQEAFLRTMTQLTFFIPLIMAMAGNAGIQSSTLVIRGLATGELGIAHFWTRLIREVVVAIAIGALLGIILVAGGAFLAGDILIGVTVGIATAISVLIAATIGTTIPMLFKRMNIDPALATGPFLTTVNDILAIIVYLLLAYWIFT